jgi:hypothetical protein
MVFKKSRNNFYMGLEKGLLLLIKHSQEFGSPGYMESANISIIGDPLFPKDCLDFPAEEQ